MVRVLSSPPPPPEIHRGLLWISLLIPPVIAGVGTPIFLIYNIFIALIAIVLGLHMFVISLSDRYRGRSLTLLGFGYFIGQSIICSIVGLGSCALMLSGWRGFR